MNVLLAILAAFLLVFALYKIAPVPEVIPSDPDESSSMSSGWNQ